MTAATATAMLDALQASIAAALDDEHADRQMILEDAAGQLTVIAGAIRAAARQDGGAVPYCGRCGAWIGQFPGLEGWRHVRSAPAPGGQPALYDPGHPAELAWCVPPGRALSPAEVCVVRRALADALAWRLDRSDGGGHARDGACRDHLENAGLAICYRRISAALARALPLSAPVDAADRT